MLKIILKISDGVNIVKAISDTISLNNKTKNFSVTKIITWHPPAPSRADLFNPFAQKNYTYDERVIGTYHMINTSEPVGNVYMPAYTNISLKWINLNAIFTMYYTIIILMALVITGIYTSNEYRKYSKIKRKDTSFIVYLQNNFRKYTKGFRKTKQSKKKIKSQTLSRETLEKLEEIEKENFPKS